LLGQLACKKVEQSDPRNRYKNKPLQSHHLEVKGVAVFKDI
jgi:hypothetical protein